MVVKLAANLGSKLKGEDILYSGNARPHKTTQTGEGDLQPTPVTTVQYKQSLRPVLCLISVKVDVF
jgi:hypothetical protein